MTPRGREPRAPRDLPPLEDGRIVASHGHHRVEVEDAAGRRVACRLHGRKLEAVCGDDVRYGFAAADPSQGTVYEIKPRRATLERFTSGGRAEPVVANLTQLIAVAAPVPAPDWFVIDRYLAGAAWCGIAAVVTINKVELGVPPEIVRELGVYSAIGYPIVESSARVAPGIGSLAERLTGATSVLVGQSGTGKSSLLNALAPEARAVTQEISAASEEGRHTTTTAVLHRLATGGDLIDSPGVRDYSPPLPSVRDVGSGFVEVARAAAGCKFQDCLHASEPGCAVRVALDAGEISARRFESYRRLLELAREFQERYPERRGRDRVR